MLKGAQELNLENPDFLCPLERGDCHSSGKIVLPALFAELDVCASGISCARTGSFCRQAFRSSSLLHARVYFSCNQYFCKPYGSARAGKLTLERGPSSLKFCMFVLCFVFHSLSLVSTLSHMLSIVNELMR